MTGHTHTENDKDADWLAQLEQLHDADQARRQAKEEKIQNQAQHPNAVELMRQGRAHTLLRQVRKALLNGKGAIKVFENAEGGYTLAIVLMWQGPVSLAREPDRVDEPYSYILIGVKEDKLWVNGKPLTEPTPAALKVALLAASKKPPQRRAK
jgi:hypothetical protein